MRKSKVKPKAGIKKKTKWQEWAITTLAITSVAATLIWIVLMAHNSTPSSAGHNHRNDFPESNVLLEPNKLCMSTNAFMAEYTPMLVLNLDGTYYACCQHCLTALQSNEAERYAIDPVSKNRISKAEAFICLHHDKSGTVCYFESKENHLAFIKIYTP